MLYCDTIHIYSLCSINVDDGGVRVWKNYSEREPELVTAWQALSSLLPSTRGKVFKSYVLLFRLASLHSI